jgi:nucleoside transporter
MAMNDRPIGPPDPRLCLMMFLQFFVWGAWYVTVGTYMGQIGLGESIGHAYTVGPIAAIISPFFLGMVADRFFASQRVLAVLHLLGGAALLAAPMVAESCVRAAAGQTQPATGQVPLFINAAHVPFLLVLLFHMLCYMPTLGLVNTICFHHMASSEKQFPIVRVFGTVGWIVAGLVLGMTARRFLPAGVDVNDKDAVNAAVAGMPHFFYLAGGAGILLGLFSLFLPHTPPPAAGKKATVRAVLGLDSLTLLAQPSFLVFILCSFLLCIPLAAYYAYAPVFVGASGFAPDDVPITMSYGQMSEIGFMLLMPMFFARLGVKWMLAVGMLAWVVRYGLFAAAGGDPNLKWMVLGGILLHGICYDFFFVTGFIYVDRKAPKEIRGQAQGFLVLVTQGLGLGVGAQVVSRIVTHYTTVGAADEKTLDWRGIWMVPAVAAGVILVVFLAAFRDDTKTDAPVAKG